MTDMSTHMEHDQENLIAELGRHAGRRRDRQRRRDSVSGSGSRSAGIVLIVLAAILAPWLPLKDPEKSYVVAGERPPYAPSSGVLVRHRPAVARHVQPHDLGRPHLAHRRLRGDRLRHARRRLARHDRRLLPGQVQRGRSRSCFVVLLSFPALVLAILITSLLNRSLFTISFTIGILAIAPVGMVSRATTISFADREFVLAARTLGAKHPRIIVRELLPNVVIPMSALALLGVAVAIVAEGGLAFLGLSVEKGITWGKLIQNGAGRSDLEDAPWIAFAPILVLFLTVLSLNFAGDQPPQPLRRQGVRTVTPAPDSTPADRVAEHLGVSRTHPDDRCSSSTT